MGVQIRALTPDDAEAYVAIRQEMLRAHPWAFASSPGDAGSSDPGVVRARLREAENVIVGAWIDGALAGTCGVVRDKTLKMRHRAWIVAVYVSPSARGRGVGKALVGAALEIARSWGGVEIVSLSVSERAPGARRLYESLGFVAWGTEPSCMKIGEETAAEIHLQRPLG